MESNSESTRELQKFDFDEIKDYSTILNIGRRRSGKSVNQRELLYYLYKKRKIKFFLLISPTSFINDDYKFIPEEYRFEKFSEKLLNNLFKRQELLIKKYGRRKEFATVLVLDDCIDLSNKRQANLLSYIFVRGRHLLLWCICSFQYIKSVELKPSTRQQLDYIFVFKQSNKDTIKLIDDEWLGGEGYKYVNEVPSRPLFRTLVIDNTEDEDNLYWYRAELIPKTFKIKKIESNFKYQ